LQIASAETFLRMQELHWNHHAEPDQVDKYHHKQGYESAIRKHQFSLNSFRFPPRPLSKSAGYALGPSRTSGL